GALYVHCRSCCLRFSLLLSLRFFLMYPPTTELYTLSLHDALPIFGPADATVMGVGDGMVGGTSAPCGRRGIGFRTEGGPQGRIGDRKSTRLNSSHEWISYAVFCLKKKNKRRQHRLTRQVR